MQLAFVGLDFCADCYIYFSKTLNLSQFLVDKAMTAILKILALLTSLASTVLVIVASVRQGLIITWAIFSVVKIVVVVLFVALLLMILYFLLTQKKVPPDHTPDQ
jgi:hypothetical protein